MSPTSEQTVPNILCIDPSASYGAMISKFAPNAGFDAHIFNSEREGTEFLTSTQPCSLLIVANQLSSGEGGHLIRNTRMLLTVLRCPSYS